MEMLRFCSNSIHFLYTAMVGCLDASVRIRIREMDVFYQRSIVVGYWVDEFPVKKDCRGRDDISALQQTDQVAAAMSSAQSHFEMVTWHLGTSILSQHSCVTCKTQKKPRRDATCTETLLARPIFSPNGHPRKSMMYKYNSSIETGGITGCPWRVRIPGCIAGWRKRKVRSRDRSKPEWFTHASNPSLEKRKMLNWISKIRLRSGPSEDATLNVKRCGE